MYERVVGGFLALKLTVFLGDAEVMRGRMVLL
jgi:hypothetical protein